MMVIFCYCDHWHRQKSWCLADASLVVLTCRYVSTATVDIHIDSKKRWRLAAVSIAGLTWTSLLRPLILTAKMTDCRLTVPPPGLFTTKYRSYIYITAWNQPSSSIIGPVFTHTILRSMLKHWLLVDADLMQICFTSWSINFKGIYCS